MGAPQLEKGFLRIANELFDAIARFPLSGAQRRCLDAVIRFTYGGLKTDGTQSASRKSVVLSYGRIATYLRLSRSSVQSAMETLWKMKILRRHRAGGMSHSWSLQKDYEQWRRCTHRSYRSVRPSGTECTTTQYTTVRPRSTVRYVRSNSTAQHPSPLDSGNNEEPETVRPAGSQNNKTLRLKTKDVSVGAAEPRSFSDLPQNWKDKLTPALEKFTGIPEFNPYAWIGLALQGKCGNMRRRFSPEAILAVLNTVNPESSADSMYAVLNTYLNSAQERLEHENRKAKEKHGTHAIDVSGLVKRMD